MFKQRKPKSDIWALFDIFFFWVFLLLNQLGGFTQRSESHTVDLTKTIGSVLKLNGAPLFDVYIDADINHKAKLAIYLDLPHRVSSFTKLLKYDRVFQVWTFSNKYFVFSGTFYAVLTKFYASYCEGNTHHVTKAFKLVCEIYSQKKNSVCNIICNMHLQPADHTSGSLNLWLVAFMLCSFWSKSYKWYWVEVVLDWDV